MKHWKNILLTLLTAALLAGFAVAVPSGSVTVEAQMSYLDQAPADADDEYAFLFD